MVQGAVHLGLEIQQAGSGGGPRRADQALRLDQVQMAVGGEVQLPLPVLETALELQPVVAQAELAQRHLQLLVGEAAGEGQFAADGAGALSEGDPGHPQVHLELVGGPAAAGDLELEIAPRNAPGRFPHMGLAMADLQPVQPEQRRLLVLGMGPELDLGQAPPVQVQDRVLEQDPAEVGSPEQGGPFQVQFQQAGLQQIAAHGQLVQQDPALEGMDLQPSGLHPQAGLQPDVMIQLAHHPAVHFRSAHGPGGEAGQGRPRGDQVGGAPEPAPGPHAGMGARGGDFGHVGFFSPQAGQVTAIRGRGR
jgi:hypothetical protein